MQRHWTSSELNSHWLLTSNEIALLKGKTGTSHAMFAVLLKHYQLYAIFPRNMSIISSEVWDFICGQLGFEWDGGPEIVGHNLDRLVRRYSDEIREYLDIRRFDHTGRAAFKDWALTSVFPRALDIPSQKAEFQAWFSTERYELPSQKVLKRLTGEVGRIFEQRLFKSIVNTLNMDQRTGLDQLLDTSNGLSGFAQLRGDPSKPSLESVLQITDRLGLLRKIGLSTAFLDSFTPALIARYRLRAGSEDVWGLRRHPKTVRLALLALYSAKREAELIDDLVDTLIGITHKISVRSERKVVSELVSEFTKVHGKTALLFRFAEAAAANPEGTVRNVIYPVAGEQKIMDLIKEYRSDGPAYVKRIYRKNQGVLCSTLPPNDDTLAHCIRISFWKHRVPTSSGCTSFIKAAKNCNLPSFFA